jgi:4-amino-4-deoxy-L-arabinose transferase-like glycosyltransferase
VERLLASRQALAVACGAVAAAAALLRLPFLGSIGPDEGGYAYVAWQWSLGRPLYRSVWVDRPQGLLLVYRALVSLALEPWAVRLGAVVAGVVVSLLLVAVGTQLVSRATGLIAGALFATVGVGPRIEGFTFNGELAAAVPAAAAIAAALRARRSGSRALYLAAGLLGAVGVLMKQSGFDGLVVAFGVAVSARRRGDVVAVGAGTAIPLAASLIAGVVGDWHAYWSGVVSSHQAVPLGARLDHLAKTAASPTHDLLLLAVIAAAGVVVSRRLPVARWLVPLWLGSAIVAVNVGGLYWPHYYVQLVPPLCLAAALALARLSVPRASLVALAAALPALFFVIHVVMSNDERREHLVRYALAFENDRRLAIYVRSHTSSAGRVYAYLSRADFYFLAHRRAAFRYLWVHPLRDTKGARAELLRTLESRDRPRFVVLFQHPRSDEFGRRSQRVLSRDYRIAWRAPGTGTPILEAVGRR